MQWFDGEAFNADDVVLTIRLALGDADIFSREAATIKGQVASVEKMDDLTVKTMLQNPNPRFAVENFEVLIQRVLLCSFVKFFSR